MLTRTDNTAEVGMHVYTAMIEQVSHGEVFKLYGRWRWLRPNGKGVEVYVRTARMLTVREHIGRLNRVPVSQVRLVKQVKAIKTRLAARQAEIAA